MFKELKEKLLNDPSKIYKLLESFHFEHINVKDHEIRFARNEEGGQNIAIKLDDNSFLYVKDFVKNLSCDIFAYIMAERSVGFNQVILQTKSVLGLTKDWQPEIVHKLFGNVLDILTSISKHNDIPQPIKTYDISVLDQYQRCGSELWRDDGISYKAQLAYNVGYDPESQRIVFPWFNNDGDGIIAVKGRINMKDVPDYIPKYLYVQPGQISSTLYNYSQCYDYLSNGIGKIETLCTDDNGKHYINTEWGQLNPEREIYVFESEKSVQKLYGWGIKNTVALGSNSLSDKQMKLLLELNPKKIYFMLDKDLSFAETWKNVAKITNGPRHLFQEANDVEIRFWDWSLNTTLPPKSAPCDGTKEQWKYILENEIKDINELKNKQIDSFFNIKAEMEQNGKQMEY